jgi:sulfite dehydrogenase
MGAGLLSPRGITSTAGQPVQNVSSSLPTGTQAEAVLDVLPGKKPLISFRPPNYETPLEYFRTPITPNDAFFVRYHLPDIPEIDATTWRLAVGGEGASSQIELTLDDVKAMPIAEVVMGGLSTSPSAAS